MTGFMQAASFVGSAGFYLPLLVLAFWCLNPVAAGRAAVVLAAGAMVNVLLKLIFADPRPYWTDPAINPLSSESSFGMPSGHAQGSTLAYGLLAYHLGRRRAWAAAGVVVVLVGVSRVHLGVHSIGQVAAGWAVGAVILVAAIRLGPTATRWWGDRGLPVRLWICAALALGALGATVVIVELGLDGWQMPPAWRSAIIAAGGSADPRWLERAAASAAVLGGVPAGLSWLAHRGWFVPSGDPWRRVLAVPVGVAGLLPILSLWLVLPRHAAAVFAVLVLVALWLTAGAPETFVRLGLAGRPTPGLTRPGEPALTEDS
ncbi:phosphatase PAP2 family protein [Thermomonospora umbrina]|uniref:PAP2 superfamily protein n=1 Tax=Thermomonospora umbrina TaxID=111806 RepID=A0A3D9SVI5_9ACTN|nr:phosphatase PAP2 family protein [Thermomonospora umbrina]REE99597.1 PAP2 superfamily protein [Thermomonospora umbrina]